MINNVKDQLGQSLPPELVDSLLKEYLKLKENFLLNKHEPGELDAGKFCEISIRVIEFISNTNHSYTPLSKPISNFIGQTRGFENLPTNINNSFRLHIPRTLAALYNIRNHRGVGHIGGDVDPNLADATFLVAGCDWILAELFRIFFVCSIEDAEKVIQQIVKRKIPLVYAIGDRKRVLKLKGYEEKVLLLLMEEFPNSISEDSLFKNSGYSNLSTFKTLLQKMDSKDLLDYHQGACTILPSGIAKAELLIINNK
ncbi:MAG: hypothetical protein WC458_01870 [Patescibacteria group bacterium]